MTRMLPLRLVFSAADVRAALKGWKTQHRLPVLPPPAQYSHVFQHPTERWFCFGDNSGRAYTSPFGHPGDRIWVREAWYSTAALAGEFLGYVADPDHPHGQTYYRRWASSMSRKNSRLTLEVLDVRVQRLSEMTVEEAHAEGCTIDLMDREPDVTRPPLEEFARRWDRRYDNRLRNFTVLADPVVWVCRFQLLPLSR